MGSPRSFSSVGGGRTPRTEQNAGGAPGGVFGGDYQSLASVALFTTGAGVLSPQAFVVKPGTTFVVPLLTGLAYRLAWHAAVSCSGNNVMMAGRLFNVTDGVTVGAIQRFQPSSNGSDEIEDMNSFEELPVASVSGKTFDVELRKFAGPLNASVSMQDVHLELWRVR